MRETNAKHDARRKKAYKNYEQSCEISGKFKVRTCPPLEICYKNQGLKWVNITTLETNKTALEKGKGVTNSTKPTATTTTGKAGYLQSMSCF